MANKMLYARLFKNKGRRSQADMRGFTLIEVLISIVILSIGLVTVVETMARTQQALRISQNLIISSQLAEEKLAEAEMEVRENHKVQYGTKNGVYEIPGKKFTWARRVDMYQDLALAEDAELNEINIQVEWKEGARLQNILKVKSILMNRDKEET